MQVSCFWKEALFTVNLLCLEEQGKKKKKRKV